MSQVITQENLLEIEIATVIGMSDVSSISELMQEVATDITEVGISMSTKESNTSVIENILVSPIELKSSFRELYNQHMSVSKSSDVLISQKEAFVQTLQKIDYRVREREETVASIRKVLQTESQEEFATVVNETMSKIQSEHAAFTVDNIVTQVRESAIAVGYADEIRVNPTNGKTIIVAQRENRALLTEIRVDASTGKIDLATESLGFEGIACDLVMKTFQEELQKRGIKFSNTVRKWTGGNSWVTSPQIQSQKATPVGRTAKDLARSRKLAIKNKRS